MIKKVRWKSILFIGLLCVFGILLVYLSNNPANSFTGDQTKHITRNQLTLHSDNFDNSTLNTELWEVLDPRNDSKFTMVSNGTKNGFLSISVPAGSEHDVWNGNNAPRVMQSVGNTDFEVEVKFESQLYRRYQMQGIIIEQDKDNFLRLDFYSDGQKTWVFGADFINGSPSTKVNKIIGTVHSSVIPLYMRVKRAGNLWTQSYSYDGTNWEVSTDFSRTLTVTSIGPFIANAGSNPAFNGRIDYFSSK